MITEEQVKQAGYRVLPDGGHIKIYPTDFPHDWESLCQDFGVDPKCKKVVLCVCGVIEINEGEEE